MKQPGLFLIAILFNIGSHAQTLDWYLPKNASYNASIPKPKDIILHEVGEWHVTHDRMVNYMKALAATAPERLKLETIGYTFEQRPQVVLIATSPNNHQQLDLIRQQHLKLSDPKNSASLNISKMPLVVYAGNSIHGNEASGINASLLDAYYLAAAQGPQIDELLQNLVIILDPSFNPDGAQRFSTWVNQHKGKTKVNDPISREFNEVWPGGRFNHYWFDLNRDWLPAVHPESQNRLKLFHNWKPNILTDHHEQGSNSTFFFQPGVPSRVNPLSPAAGQDLTASLGNFHAKFLDSIGTLYFSKEMFDDFYYGKGSTYPDINGGIGILFEQASSRGHVQQTANGELTFPATIRNQFTTFLSTIEGAKELRADFLNYQRNFYRESSARAKAWPVKAYVFGDKTDRTKTKLFAEMLLRHKIQIYDLPAGWKNSAGNEFEKGSAFIVPSDQPQHTLVRTIFDKTLNYKDSLFYDITAWTMPLAFGLPYQEMNALPAVGEEVNALPQNKGSVEGEKSNYAYVINWENYYAPNALYSLLNDEVIVKAATNPFTLGMKGKENKFSSGSLIVPVQMQKHSSDSIYAKLSALANQYDLKVYALSTGAAVSGSDLGSNYFRSLRKPVVALLTGQGVNALDAGEVWFQIDNRMDMPLLQLEQSSFNSTNLESINTIIMVAGSYAGLNKEKLKNWVQNGGTLILGEEAVRWAAENNIGDVRLKKPKVGADSSLRLPYADRANNMGSQSISGAIVGAETDLTHPLAYGYNTKTVSLFKANKVFLEKSKNPYNTPFFYGSKPLQSGWVSGDNMDQLKNSAAVVVSALGRGKVISIADNPNFRGFWLGGSKLYMNAIFFAPIIEAGPGERE